ncbi:AMP-binding protein [uncultured Aliiroseovarius sp.]|uniref:class I adenylate-forming enzyme family protein n=1 Tax=uncultured Aliiroseovarius sp. TaxID=1658783 RepID=UPI002620005E|nr:AMP-binding protein [uncultured Aliiroseovarius sp.]
MDAFLARHSPERAIADWVEDNSEVYGNAPALFDMTGSVAMTHAEVADRVSALVREFRALGIGRDTRVAVCLTDGPETLTVLLALMSMSAVLPIHPTAAVDTFEKMVEKLDISVVIGAHRPVSAAWKIAEARGICYVAVETDPSSPAGVCLTPHRRVDNPSRAQAGLDDVALYISTSGTTGSSTVVAITQRSLDRNVATHGALNGYGPGDRAICVMSFTYLFAYVRASLPILQRGGAVIVAPGYRFADMQSCCETLKPTSMTATPTILQKLLADCDARGWRPEPGVLQRLHATGEAIPDTLRARLHAMFGARLGTNYGMTEVSPQVAAYGSEEQFEPGAVGRIVTPWCVDIVDENGAALPLGSVGRIALRGGYVNAIVGAEKETRFDQEGRFLTGDRGFVDDAGILFIAGRADEVINRGGEKLDPKVIEQSLERDPDVQRAVVFGVPDPKLGQKIVALIVLRKGATRSVQDIREGAGTQIAGWGMPERLVVVPDVPTNANGKVSRRDLSLRYADA